jgi:hypothetical protein
VGPLDDDGVAPLADAIAVAAHPAGVAEPSR